MGFYVPYRPRCVPVERGVDENHALVLLQEADEGDAPGTSVEQVDPRGEVLFLQEIDGMYADALVAQHEVAHAHDKYLFHDSTLSALRCCRIS